MKPEPLAAETEVRVKNRFETLPYQIRLGIRISRLASGFAELTMEITPEHLQGHGVAHGGAIVSLLDSAVACTLATLFNGETPFLTIDLKTNFLRSVRRGQLRAEGRVIRAGRRVLVGEARAYDEDKKLVAIAIENFLHTAG